MKTIIGAVVAGIFLIGLVWVLWSLRGYKEARQDVILGGIRVIFATRGELDKYDPALFPSAEVDGLVIHRGWFRTSIDQPPVALIYSLHPEHFTDSTLAPLPALFVHACLGTYTDKELKGLDPEVASKVGVLFHELIGHGSDAYEHGHPLAMINRLWPGSIDPVNETVQNPWRIIRKYWPSDATHPLLETASY